MTLEEICESICLQSQMKRKVLNHEKEIDEKTLEPWYIEMYNPVLRDKAVKQIAGVLGEDPEGSKMLTVMLLRTIESYKEYQKRGISNTIFKDTMKFCTRFIDEHYEIHGSYAFVWGWWFPRQIALQEFRIGALEYEMIEQEGKKLINIHIPADADMDRKSLKQSYVEARSFFAEFFPEYEQSDMVCDSWLLSPTLRNLLPENSNIVIFQEAFDITKVKQEGDSGIRWVYGRTDIPVHELPEHTSLQKRIKTLLLEGGNVGEAYGRLKSNPWEQYY